MFVSHKSNVILQIQETEWLCRMLTKGMDTPEYWPWLESITDSEGVPDYSGEDYEIVETDAPLSYESTVDGVTRTISFTESEHIHEDGTYSLKWDATKKEIVKDDTAKAAWELAEEWKQIRRERTRLLEETDYMGNSDVTMTAAWKAYRKSLRDLPADQSSKTKYSDITWPTKPS